MKASELRELDAAELRQQLVALRREQLQMRLSSATGQEARVHRHRQIRRDIARVKTVMREEAGGGRASPPALGGRASPPSRS